MATPCSIEGCDGTNIARGWCRPHYRSWWKYGDPLAAPGRPKAKTECSVEGCTVGGRIIRGYCNHHYELWRRHGEPVYKATEPGTVAVDGIEFNGIKFRRYPDAKKANHRRYYSPGGGDIKRGVEVLHREIWKFYNGPIPEGAVVHHVDENPLNNDISNLTLMENGEHVSHHTNGKCSDAQRAHLDAIRHLATEWHRSDEGREWHRQHALRQGFGTRVQHANQ